MSIEQIVARLDDRFLLLGTARSSDDRHQTLRKPFPAERRRPGTGERGAVSPPRPPYPLENRFLS
jgi:hypothetical protein